jgi:hypothetical protein
VRLFEGHYLAYHNHQSQNLPFRIYLDNFSPLCDLGCSPRLYSGHSSIFPNSFKEDYNCLFVSFLFTSVSIWRIGVSPTFLSASQSLAQDTWVAGMTMALLADYARRKRP